ncbi:MAG TPA: LytTR family DNA-binding domain-containing protein [Flavisolibacter sp.]|nr:LytTR family DNA-binding domain-containing protein [Flavisolibacter sp.]
MNILVLEDETLVAKSLMVLLKQLEPEATINGPVETVKGASEILSKSSPDLIISDIQLADGISLDVFNQQKIQCPIIFTTAYNEYAIRAFKLNSIDYLLKPIDKEELKAALDKFHLLQSKFSNEVYLKQMAELFANFNNAKKYKERFAVHVGRSVTLISVDEIALFSKEEVIYLINKDGKKFITDYRSLDEIQDLVNPAIFYRANRQHIVHLPFIESYRSDDTGKLTLKMRNIKTDELIVSKEKAVEFRKWFE